ncbi:hypothetical protein LCGC14_1321470, partial [marine sediment metagenome]
MTGTRDKNLRSGDIHEDLGLLLLRGIALATAIPRTEDVGADAFATLLREASVRSLVAEESFLVQFKASSVRTIQYETPTAIDWLTQLEMPFFVGSVDLASAAIKLYATHCLSQIFLESRHSRIHLHLDPVDRSQSRADVRHTNLGKPVLTWSVPDITQKGFLSKAYAVLKGHISVLRRNLLLRPLGSADMVRWEPGQPPKACARMMFV